MEQYNEPLSGAPSCGDAGAVAAGVAATAAAGSHEPTPRNARRPYLPPDITVIDVRTERGYAASGTPSSWGPPTNW